MSFNCVISWWQSKLPSASTVVSSRPFCQEEKHMHDRITSMRRGVNIQAIGANTWWHVNCKSECATILGLSSISFCSLLPPWLPVYVFSLNLLLLYWQILVFDFKCSMKEEIYVVSSNHHVVYTKVKTPLEAPSTNRHFLCFFSFLSGFFVDTFCHTALCPFLSLRGGYLSYG